ncbi:MAG: hypothetical protein L6Q68_13105 [Aquabacterium sp.]|jgi:hypothetical protein|nr:hypothetical protein [Aquabacterium sp.]
MAIVAGMGATSAHAADAVLTLLEGSATVVDGARALRAALGLRLSPGAIVESGPQASLVRVEFADGSVLDLGPATRVMLQPPGLAGSGPRPPGFYLLEGWAKHSSATGARPVAGQLTVAAELTQLAGVAVSRAGPGLTEIFVETGQGQGIERRGRAKAPIALRAGEFFRRSGSDKGEVLPRPDPAFLKDVPRAFRDTIAPQAGRLLGRPPVPQPAAPPTYDTLQPWLVSEPVIRREFPRRFAALAREGAFRAALERHLSAHPEWDAVLHPPKPPGEAQAVAADAAASMSR